MDWTNSFMQPEIYEGYYFEVDTSVGTEIVPQSALQVGEDVHARLSDFVEGHEIYDVILKRGFLARLSAPGYMDCTEWAAHATEDEAIAYLDQMFGDD